MKNLNIHVEAIAHTEQVPFALLQLADPSRKQIESYLETGTCYKAILENELIGAMVICRLNSSQAEIKNIAVKASKQGKGYGKALLRIAKDICRNAGYEVLAIGTGNSSIGQLALYQKEGFELERIEKNFFLKHYDEPIFENGIQCKHMLILQAKL